MWHCVATFWMHNTRMEFVNENLTLGPLCWLWLFLKCYVLKTQLNFYLLFTILTPIVMVYCTSTSDPHMILWSLLRRSALLLGDFKAWSTFWLMNAKSEGSHHEVSFNVYMLVVGLLALIRARLIGITILMEISRQLEDRYRSGIMLRVSNVWFSSSLLVTVSSNIL